ncbi:MAG: septal ring lytic transglycosylase RlpA family protein [Candidatus Acidiferrales bacterium]
MATILGGCAHHHVSSQPPAQTPSSASQPRTGPGASRPSGAPPATERQPAVPGEYVEEGVASWYGLPFNGRRTSNGEIYDMHELTAAHRTLPFNAVVRVTNLRNGKQTQVRINDRGPFVADRIIDLSLSAAEAIEMVGPGTAQVRLEIVSGPNPTAGVFAVQIGAFVKRENAQRLKAEMEARSFPVTIVTFDSANGLLYRVRVGRLATEQAAGQLAAQLHSSDEFTTFVVRLDE